MNDEELERCRNIFNAVLRRPIAQLFWDISSDVSNQNLTRPYSFSYIYDKLNKRLYPTMGAFVNDLRQVFMNTDKINEKHSIRVAAVSLLMKDLEKALVIYPPKEKSLSVKLKSAIKNFEQIEDILKLSDEQEEPFSISSLTETPGCEFIEKVSSMNPNEISCSELKYEISILLSSKLVLMVIQHIFNLQPEAISVEKSITIMYSILTKENIAKIHLFIVDLLNDVALGKIDGNPSSFLDESKPPLIQEISFSKKPTQKKKVIEKEKKK